MRKHSIKSALLTIGILAVQLCPAQVPAGAPAGSTGLCNDGTYYRGAVKRGACSRHKGVKQWWGAQGAGGAALTEPARSDASAGTPPPAAGNDKVWLNISSNVYHCPGAQWYGKTKSGVYMSESDARQKGARPANGKPCK